MPQLLSANPLGLPFIELQSVDSTNNYALTQIHAGLAHHGMAFFTHEQVAGKGQRGKTWSAPKDTSLILSVVVAPQPMELAQQFWFSACVAVSVQEFFARYAGEATMIKWPNDIYWHDRKAGGILIESIVRSQSPQWQWAVAGIGMNINQAEFSHGLKNPVSLRQITGSQFNTVSLAKELCQTLDKNFQLLLNEGFEDIYQAYLRHLYKRKEQVRFRKGTRVFEATVVTVTRTGGLIVKHSVEEEFAHGEVEWQIPPA